MDNDVGKGGGLGCVDRSVPCDLCILCGMFYVLCIIRWLSCSVNLSVSFLFYFLFPLCGVMKISVFCSLSSVSLCDTMKNSVLYALYTHCGMFYVLYTMSLSCSMIGKLFCNFILFSLFLCDTMKNVGGFHDCSSGKL